MAQVGRISGPLLFANLERNGIDISFTNTLDDTRLLYLDVNTGKIGVNTDTPAYTLDIAGTIKTGLQKVGNQGVFGDISIEDSTISNLTGDINLKSARLINLSNFETDTLHISDNTISTFDTNANIDLNTNGTGTIEVLGNLNIYGDLHATGDVTMDGNIEFGDSTDDSTYNTDTVTFEAEFDSDILPDETETFHLGRSDRRWGTIHNNTLNSTGLVFSNLVLLDSVDITARAGNIIYVSQFGNDTNVGDHPSGAFKTLKRALEFADASTDGPVTIYIFAGGYEEELPLEVPSQVSIVGQDFRNTIIRPESAYQSEDVFLMNGESTVSNLTIKDFYYDSGNNKGFAFKFAPNTVVTTRSPYIQNVTVITQGSTTSANDPRGYSAGDAGRGAYIDGASVLSASQEASMLFHSCTFITPGVTALAATNGVRVEWLNSFTYFASTGLDAFNGSTGHLSTDGSTLQYGAELRSIGSANVYGEFGAKVDGNDCIMYLIQHNFAYIGSEQFVDNDPSRADQTKEVTEANSGRIYYQSIDHLGNFRVGNNFVVNQEEGTTSLEFNASDFDLTEGMTITTGSDVSFIDGTGISIGNFRLRDNNIDTVSGDINISSASEINLQSSTNISKNLDITGNLTFDGSLLTIGDSPTDTVDFNTPFSQNIEPDISGLYSLGSSSNKWSKAWLSQAQISDILIQDNFITTIESNADLEFRANGTGTVYLPDNNFTVTNDLTVDGATNLQNTIELSSALVHTLDNPNASGTSADDRFGWSVAIDGGRAIVGAFLEDDGVRISSGKAYIFDVATGSLLRTLDNPSPLITSSGDTFGYSVAISGNYAVVGATGEDEAGMPSNNNSGRVYIFNVTTGSLLYTLTNPNAYGTSDADNFGSSVAIDGNSVIVGTSDEDDAGGTFSGKAYIYDISTFASFTPSIISSANYVLDNPNAYGTSFNDRFAEKVAISGNYAIVGARFEDDASGTQSGKAYIFDATTGNLLHTLDNPNPFGTSADDFFGNSVAIDGNYAIVGATGEDDAGGIGVGKAYIFDVATGSLIRTLDNPNAYSTSSNDGFGGSVAISGNYAIVGATGEDEPGSSGSGKVYIFNVTTGSLVSTLDNPNAYGTRDGDAFGVRTAISGNDIIVGTYFEVDASGGIRSGIAYVYKLTIPDPAEVNITGNVVQTGSFQQTGNNTVIGNLTIEQDLNISSEVQLEEIKLDDNVISTTSSNADLVLAASGTGNISVPENNVVIENNLEVRDITSVDINTPTNVTSVELVASDTISIRDNYLSTINTNANIEFRANGTGRIYSPNKVQIDNDLSVDGSLAFTGNLTGDDVLGVENIASDQFYAEKLNTDAIAIWDNNISTVISNADLELRATGVGHVNLELLKIKDNELLTDTQAISFTPGDQQLTIIGEGALTLPVGDTSQRLNTKGDIRFNSETQLFEGYGNSNIGFGGVFSDDMLTSLTVDQTSNDIRMIVSGDNNPVDSTAMFAQVKDGLYTNKLDTGDIELDGNLITSTLSNSNLDLRATGSGEFIVDNVSVVGNTIKNNTPNRGNLVFANTGYGAVKIDNTYGVVIPVGDSLSSGVYEDRINIINVVSVGATTIIELASAHGLDTGDTVFISQVESSFDDNLELLNTDDSSSPGSHGVVSAPTSTRLEIAVDTTGANLSNYIPNTGYIRAFASVQPPTGDTRWNTDTQILETWDGEQYLAATGTAAAISVAEYDDILLEFTLALG